MKNIKIKYLLSIISMALLVLGVFSSCSEDSADSGSGTLTITSVAKAEEGDLVPVTQGDPKNYYIIRGSGFTTVEKIYFNDFDTYFNPVLVTDTEIFVLIDEKTPYADASSKLKVVTKLGTIVYDFVISPPSPTFGSFNPINAVEGDVITIYGNYFLNPIVKVGAESVPVISSTLTEIKIKLPAGADKKYISVSNISGTATSTDAIGCAIYDDVFWGIDGVGGWGVSNTNIENTTREEVAQGDKAIKVDITPWSGFQIDMWANGGHPVPANAIGIKFQMKLKAAAKMRVVVGGDWGHEVWFNLTSEYATYVVKWSDLGMAVAPATIGQIVFGSDGTATTFYIDNLGFALK
ncbi:IPT/TIG domain-containing protein [Flavobacterium taihuense]|uniref:IPT/TIG domain-containing protein n=1 Tax=Flavobacterium taihuense TaxID=2857508 RepID=A0ABS6XW01_9FLAO|nr:IPT/TIG domain-containing protein [Flavobacterium taihuense]MBW4360863.1 IPT/TIG domain-containing protein [Flavobacterium taihuense]